MHMRTTGVEGVRAALEALGLKAGGFDRGMLGSAFRRESMRMHPDKGGTEEDFRGLKRHYRVLKAFLSESGPPPPTHSDMRRRRPIPAAGAKQTQDEFNRRFDSAHVAPDDGLGEWFSSKVPEDMRCPDKVSFKRFDETFAAMAKKNALSLIVRTGPAICPANCTLAAGLMSDAGDDYGSGVGQGLLAYSDLRVAHGQQMIDAADAESRARAVALGIRKERKMR